MRKPVLLILFATASIALLRSQSSDTPPYNWSKTGPLQVARQGACAAALQDGRILVVGGRDITRALRSVEIYHQDGSFTPARDMLRARAGHTCTSLPDGRVLVAGGLGDGPAVQAETYDPATDRWMAAKSGTERWNHTATLLSDGRVLLAGGETADGPSALLEWFNPASNRIRKLPVSLSAARTLHASAALPDGSVVVTGGWNSQNLLDSTEIVQLNGSLQSAAVLPIVRAGHTATALDNGCVLIAGGIGTDGDLKSASRYCANTGTFQDAGSMSKPRYGHLALWLPNNGKVLIIGGFSQGEAIGASELYDPNANAFVPAGSLTLARLGIAAAADLAGGAVLAVGGYTSDGPVDACGILHSPSIVFDKVRYLDGDPVTLTGLTWTPGETVKLTVTTQPFTRSGQLLPITTQNFQTVASALGRIQITPFTASTSTVGAAFRVTATGATSGLTASTLATQVSRTNMTLSVFPFPALTRQPVTLQAIVQPVTALDTLDGTVNFQLGTAPLGSVSSTQQFITVSPTGQITDGTSNTIQLGQSLSLSSTGFGTTYTAADGSVRFLNPGGAFQLVTRDIPAGSSVLTANGPGSVTSAYAALTSLYAPSTAQSTVSVQKRGVNVAIPAPTLTLQGPKVGDSIALAAIVIPTQQPLADVMPTGKLHISTAPGTVTDVALSPSGGISPNSQGTFNVRLPAGTTSFSAQYDGDSVYLPGSATGVGTITVGKGTLGFSLIPGKTSYIVGEKITLLGRILHPKVVGATPTGQITRTSGPVQFQGASVGTDPKNSGLIDTDLPVAGFPPPGNLTVSMTYGGDSNFLPVSAGAILTISKAIPVITVIPPAQVVAGQTATFVVRAASPANLSAPPVSGQVTFSGLAKSSSANLVAGTSSVATARLTFPSAGTFSITLQYSGDANYLTTTSAPIQVVVASAANSRGSR